MFERNENFVNPELIQTMGSSSDESIRTIFQLNLDQYGKVIWSKCAEGIFEIEKQNDDL